MSGVVILTLFLFLLQFVNIIMSKRLDFGKKNFGIPKKFLASTSEESSMSDQMSDEEMEGSKSDQMSDEEMEGSKSDQMSDEDMEGSMSDQMSDEESDRIPKKKLKTHQRSRVTIGTEINETAYEEAHVVISAKNTLDKFMNDYLRQCIPPYWHLEKIWQIRNALKRFFDPQAEKPQYIVDMYDRMVKDLESNKVLVKDFIEEKIKLYGDWLRFTKLYDQHCTHRTRKPNIICSMVLKNIPKIDPTFKSILSGMDEEMLKRKIDDKDSTK